jgi:hypothetical protein
VFVVEVHGGLIQIEVRFQVVDGRLPERVLCGLPAEGLFLNIEGFNLNSPVKVRSSNNT